MPRKAAAGAAPGPRPRTGNRSIRGQISGPIPIPDPMDDEFPMRSPGTAMVTPLDGAGNVVNDAKADTHAPEPDQRQQLADTPSANPSHAEATGSDHDGIEALLDTVPPKSSPPSTRRESPKRVTKPARDQRASAISSDTARARGGKDGPQRKRPAFMSALGRLFGRKKKNSFMETINLSGRPTPAAASNEHHRSVPSGEIMHFKTAEPKRYASLPITEYDRALRSHSIGPEDVMAIQSARSSLNADMRLSGKRAGAFDATMTRPAGPRWTEGRKFTGLSPRPASSHDRGTRLADCSEDPDEIGRAITSDTQGLRRRSRSLSAFPIVESAAPGVARRRSDEIRHWRESHDPPVMSPVSSSAPEIEDVGVLAADERGTVVKEPPRTPVIPFTFEDVHSMKEVAGLKITEAASLDSRICSLESQMRRLEQLVTQLGESVPGFGSHIDPPSRTSPSVPAREPAVTSHPRSSYRNGNEGSGSPARPSSRHSDVSKMTFGDGPSYPETTPRATPQPAVPNSNRPTSMTTIQGATGPPSIPKEMAGTITMDHYTTLVGLLEIERSAREALESQVRKLGRQISLMNRLPGYAHPRQSEAASVDRSFGETSVFDHDDEDEDGCGINGRKHSRPSLRLADSDATMGGHDDDDYTESFVTPNEDGRGFDAFGDNEDPALKSAARALSLSRLTLGQPPAAMHQVQPQAI
ncbi:hypothetical protein TOPH_00411 [Tolypocladium ophioglossoides CBS 100239]|uniref:Uncharacterized protein n=1 Tax=Tolypocladium ophioglossoides (strain CBS 100239) TaxID=1163406 RepID=A0A0L0NLR0_TOLOC|nr:hypothetical protein TOPH_00411 [Tolypocladium ophioglossoides CBS 100239]